jgi:hypothetical protein
MPRLLLVVVLSHKALSGKLLQALGIRASPALRGVVATDRLRVTDEMADFGAHP